MADNKDKKVLNVPHKREHNQTCLCSAEREGLRPQGNVPHLRFPEFSGEWEKCSIQDYGEVVTGNTPPTSHAEYYENGSYLWASPADLGNNKNITETKTKLSLSGFKKTRSIPKGSVLVTCIGSTIGKMGMAAETMSSNQQINSIVVNDKSNSDFVYYAICRAFPRYLSEVAVQAVPILSKSNFEKLPNYTTCRDEQDKIGYFLNLLDERIATQNKVIEDLKKLKSAIAETVFNNMQGHLTNLSAICNIVKGTQVNGEELSEKGKYYVMNGGITPSGYYDQCNTPANTISVSEGGNSCGYVQYNKSSFWSGGHCYTLQDITSGVDTQYLFHYLKRYESNIMNLRIGTGLPNIQKKDLENFRIALPPSNVQKEISTCLTAIEDKIMVEVKWLDSAQKEKQHLLRQMFI